MSDQKIEFMEDPAKFKPTQVQEQIKGTSIEGWVHKKLPGDMKTKRFVLISIALLLFGLSIYLILLAYMNTNEDEMKQNFEQKIQNTQLR